MKNDNNWLPSPESGNSLSNFYKIWLNIANGGNVNIHNITQKFVATFYIEGENL